MIQIVGVDHWLQEWELWTRREYVLGEPSEDELDYRRASKSTFYDLLERLIASAAIAVIAEECREGQDTIPKRLAAEKGIRYSEIDMTTHQRQEAGIAKNYEGAEDTKSEGYALREDWMAKITLDSLEKDRNALVVCGAIHCVGLQQRFEAHGFDVQVLDVSKEPWARNPMLKSMQEGFQEANHDPL
jgi:uncharacterized protein YPO0396